MMDDFDFEKKYAELNRKGGTPPPGGRPGGSSRPQTPSGGSYRGGPHRERYRHAQPLFGQGARRFRPSFMDSLPSLWGVDLALGLLTLLIVVCIITGWECVSIAIVSNILQILSAVLAFLTLALIGMFPFRSVFRRGRFF